ncbi:MarR family winged helix-turn-helix transcriptional regulator [Leisingera sp. ANG-Vp]|uniref:MarR family winged helix-turn-helix transcriptional regulator n=1 Tax=Leisingera sp. ANG-Vp TaxID=1577896 RepID=UPI0019D3ECF4|nr:MarR family winged helix-turn-helix transcriptional regulator [Leisingera sp. ANG-Vp]
MIPYIRKEGTRQAEIAARMGISKQAVQQLVLDLEQAGIVQRKPDPADRRGKIITFTDAGLAAQRDSAKVKLAVEQELRQQLGKQDFEALHRILGKIGSGPQE